MSPAISTVHPAVRLLPWLIVFGALALGALHVVNLTPGTAVYVVGIAALGALAFGNGANDLPKSISTLIGAGASSRSRALALGSLATLAGAAVSLFVSSALVRLFSTGGITSESIAGEPALATAIALSAAVWVLGATRFGLPVSTTHAVVGASVGAAVVAAGSGAVNWDPTAVLVAVPLLVGPLLAAGLGSALGAAITRADRRKSAFRRFSSVHFASAVGSGAARAWNDTPKLVGVGYLLLGAEGEGGSLSTALCLTGLVAAAMLIGGVWASRRVDETLGFRLVSLTPSSGLAANAANAVLVSGASILGLPLSATHVSGGALVGASLGTRKRPPGNVAGEVLAAWVLTVPGAGLLAAVAFAVLRLAV